ncbi:flagellar export protein FliJ [Derxia gummosa]|uniref:Flagellar FliJ protein n=1 Tax=Derxia gummosa DSM 723 TaxID=1121388 RepID=A0A8B6X779_9BURK|nr:flagellar export protein FliJ [Derxia gummosa]
MAQSRMTGIPNAAAFSHLIERAADERDNAARALANASLLRDDSRNKVEMLETYRRDYLQRMRDGMERVDGPGALAQFGAFVAKLEGAIKQQTEDYAFREQVVAKARAIVLEAERKLRSLETYVARKEAIADLKAARRESKLNDEFAQRIAMTRLAAAGDHA